MDTVTQQASVLPRAVAFPPAGSMTTQWTPPYKSCYDFDTPITNTIDTDWFTLVDEGCTYNWKSYYSAASYYSPAICPFSMTSAGERPDGFGPTLEATEFATMCCYSGMKLTMTAVIPETPKIWQCYTTAPYISHSISIYTVTSVSSSTTRLRTTAYVVPGRPTPVMVLMDPIQVRWASTDLSNLKPPPTALPSTSAPTATATATESPATVASRLSSGAQAGIAIGVIILVLTIAGLGIFATRRRRKAKHGANDQPELKIDQPVVVGSKSSAAPALAPPVASPDHNSNRISEATIFLASSQNQQHNVHETTSPSPSHPATMHPPPRSFSPPSYAQRPGSAPGTVLSSTTATSGGGGTDREDLEIEYRRLQERRTRLMEIHRLSVEEDRLRSHLSGEVAPGSVSELMDTEKSHLG